MKPFLRHFSKNKNQMIEKQSYLMDQYFPFEEPRSSFVGEGLKCSCCCRDCCKELEIEDPLGSPLLTNLELYKADNLPLSSDKKFEHSRDQINSLTEEQNQDYLLDPELVDQELDPKSGQPIDQHLEHKIANLMKALMKGSAIEGYKVQKEFISIILFEPFFEPFIQDPEEDPEGDYKLRHPFLGQKAKRSIGYYSPYLKGEIIELKNETGVRQGVRQGLFESYFTGSNVFAVGLEKRSIDTHESTEIYRVLKPSLKSRF